MPSVALELHCQSVRQRRFQRIDSTLLFTFEIQISKMLSRALTKDNTKLFVEWNDGKCRDKKGKQLKLDKPYLLSH